MDTWWQNLLIVLAFAGLLLVIYLLSNTDSAKERRKGRNISFSKYKKEPEHKPVDHPPRPRDNALYRAHPLPDFDTNVKSIICETCGMSIPNNIGTCPFCGEEVR